MANYERDKDDTRIFDGGDDDEAEGSHLPVVIIIAILVLAAFGGVVWLAYNQGVARGRSDVPVQVASTESDKSGQIKVYQEPAGAEDDEDVPTTTTNPLTAQPASPKPESEAVKPAAPQPKPAAPKPDAVASKPAPPTPAAASVALRPSTSGAPKPVVAIVPKPAATVTPAPVTVAQAASSMPKPQTPPVVATKPPAQLGLAHPAQQVTTASAKPAVTPPPKAVAAVAPKPILSKPAAGSYLLQIGAYKSDAEAMAAWKTYQAKHAALLKGFSPDVQRADLGDRGVWYRLRVSSFADKGAASALCDRLKAESGACFLAR